MPNKLLINNVLSEHLLFLVSSENWTTPGDKKIIDMLGSYSTWRILPEYKRKSFVKFERKMASQATCAELTVPDGHKVPSVVLLSQPPADEGKVACAWRWANHFPQNQRFNILLGTKVKLDWKRTWFGNRLRFNKWNSLWEVPVFPNTEHSL